MKATGIVRRIDDLGRVVIPKEIRRTLRIREGDPLEIYTHPDGEVIFKKYSPVGELSPFADQYVEVLAKTSSKPTIICDRDHIVAVAGVSKKEYLERRVSPGLEDLMQSRRKFLSNNSDMALKPVEGIDSYAKVAYPIISSGDVNGAVIMLSENEFEDTSASDTEQKLVQTAAEFLGKQLEC
ncbi:MAG: stage V sporulation T C-terminal domain-containing protein [Clostridia bacterium]|nr:stage V sporulation T C-terminal domain-containing protein [Clostridia bacterium]